VPGFHWLPDAWQERLLDREGRRDARRLLAREPRLEAALRASREAGSGDDPVEDAYRAYVELPGPDPVMAASLPFARFLRAWCEAREPARVADLGSGFTSWVLRWWARDGGPERLLSVDDDPEWLEVSRRFVRERGLGDGGFLSWEEFLRDGDRFDLLVWDFSGVKRRAVETRRASRRVAEGGALLFDDIHKARLWHRARWLDWLGPAEGYSLRAFTMDEFGRYAWLGLF